VSRVADAIVSAPGLDLALLELFEYICRNIERYNDMYIYSMMVIYIHIYIYMYIIIYYDHYQYCYYYEYISATIYIYSKKVYKIYKYIFQILSTPGSVCIYIYVTFCNNPQKLFELFFWKAGNDGETIIVHYHP